MTEQPDMNSTKFAKILARGIFKSGDMSGSPCNRLAFKGGRWPDKERDQGGMCEAALVKIIDAVLPQHEVSTRTLRMMDRAVKNLRAGRVSKPVKLP